MTTRPPSDGFIALILFGIGLAGLVVRHTGRRVLRGILDAD